LNHLREDKKETEIPGIVSINCMATSEWTVFAKDFQDAGADALELNIFIIPNDLQMTSLEIEEYYLRILTEVKKKVTIPVAVKIGSYFTNLVSMSGRLSAKGANSLVLFNRFFEPDIDLDKLEMSASEVFSSPSDIRNSLRWIGLISAQLPHIDIAAATGIHDADAVIKQILAGAKVAQICSTVYINGLEVIAQINEGLDQFMNKWNFKSIESFRGRLSYNSITNPSIYERAQFMKYLQGKNSIDEN